MKAEKIAVQVENYLSRVKMVQYVRKDGTISEFPAAKRGNPIYAYRNKRKLLDYKKGLLEGAADCSVMFITLVIPGETSWYGCRDAWRAISGALGPFIKNLRKMGLEKYIATLEATGEGCSHAHILCRWDRRLQTNARKDKRYLAEKSLSKSIRERWGRAWAKVSELKLNSHAVSIRVCPNSAEAGRAFCYATKHLGIWSDITEPLRRVRNNKAAPHDSAKILANYWARRLCIRLCRTSRGLGKVERFL